MHQNQSGLYSNNLSSHATLLLSTTSPTIINSPLQNNTNNTYTSPPNSALSSTTRRLPSTPLLVSSNLDNDSHMNNESPSSSFSEEYINFKKPQNEIFKQIDGKIQKIVAAHSNLNKLYALNDFSSLGLGPKRPFELPPQLPPPPPWVPKGGVDFVSSWNEDSISPLSTLDEPSNMVNYRPSSSMLSSTNMSRSKGNHIKTGLLTTAKSPILTIDSAISRLHQRRHLQHNQQKFIKKQAHSTLNTALRSSIPSTSSSSTNSSAPTITPAEFDILIGKIRETFRTEGATKTGEGTLSSVDGERFKNHLLEKLLKDIKTLSPFKNTEPRVSLPPPPRPRQTDPKLQSSLKSPKTIYDTICRETKLYLDKLKQTEARKANLSLLKPQHINRSSNEDQTDVRRQPIVNRIQHTIKVVVPPTEFQQKLDTKEVVYSGSNQPKLSRDVVLKELSIQTPTLTYQVIRNKIRLFQMKNQIWLGSPSCAPDWLNSTSRKKMSPQKSIGEIVNKLQAKWSSSPTEPSLRMNHEPSPQQKLVESSAKLLQASRRTHSMSAPTPIPVFRSPLMNSSKHYYSTSSSRLVSLKSKKSKNSQHLGLKLGNYLEKECPQPNTEKITLDQFAKCLNLVRANDACLERQKEKLSRSESRWRIPVGNRPLRLRRIRGERMTMPASASYRATSKVGLQ